MALHNITGKSGEDIAANWIKDQGYTLVSRNFSSRLGEIDIIAKDGPQIVFIEVKTRSSTVFGAPASAITPKKLSSLIKTAEYYLLMNKIGRNYRIDAVEVIMKNGSVESIHHIKNITL